MKRNIVIRTALILFFSLLLPCFHALAEDAPGILELPGDLQIIEEEAFEGSASIESAVVPEGTKEIRSRAFAGSSLKEIELPRSLTLIAGDAFSGCEGLTATVHEDSYAHMWCRENGVAFVLAGAEEQAGTVWRAVLIGNTYPGTDSALTSPDEDAYGMRRMLELQTATPYRITLRLNQTDEAMEQTVREAFSGADEDDVSLFYYSGHGAYSDDTGYMGALCGVEDTYMTARELRILLDTVPGKKIVLLDCCYSGAHIGKSAGNSAAGQFNRSFIAAFSAGSKNELARDGYTVLTACSQNEMSWEFSYGDEGFSLFTHGICMGSGADYAGLQYCPMYADTEGNGDGQTTLGEAFSYARDYSVEWQSVQYHGDPQYVLWARSEPYDPSSMPMMQIP